MKCLFSVKDFTHYIVEYCYIHDNPISNLTLQKVLYILNVTYYSATRGKEFLFRPVFEAWPYGPIVRSVYEEYFMSGGYPIQTKYDVRLNCDKKTLELINKTIDYVIKMSPYDMNKICMSENSPWYKTYNKVKGSRAVIDYHDIIKVHTFL